MKFLLGLFVVALSYPALAATFDHPEAASVFHSGAVRAVLTAHSDKISKLETRLESKTSPLATDEKRALELERAELLSPVLTVTVSDVKLGEFDITEGSRSADYSGKASMELSSKKYYGCEVFGTVHQIGKTLRWAVTPLTKNCALTK